MPTLEVPKQQVQPKVTPGLQLPPGAFGAEGRALQQLGKSMQYAAHELSELRKRILKAEEQDQYDDGWLEHKRSVAERNSELGKNREATREEFDKNYDEDHAKILEKIKSPEAYKRLKRDFALEGLSEGTKYEVALRRYRVAEARLKTPIFINQFAQDFANDDTPEGQADTIGRVKEKLSNDVISGVQSEAEAQDIFRRFTMMAVREHAENDPKRTAEAVKSRASLKELGLTDEMIASLSAEDLDELQRDAKSEIEGRKAEIAAADKVAVEEADNEYYGLFNEGDFSASTRQKLKNDPRYDKFEKERTAMLKRRSDMIKSINDEAGKIATSLEKSTARNNFKNLVDRGRFEEADKYYTQNAGIFDFPELKEMSDYLRRAKTGPTNPLLTDFINASEDLTATRVKIAEGDEEKQNEERINGIARNANLRKLFADPKKTNKQKFEEANVMITGAQEAAAKEITLHWLGRWLRPKETTPFWRHIGTTEETALARKKAKAGIKEEITGKSIKLQRAPDIRLDDYWKDLTDKQKRDIWVQFDKNPESINRIIEMIRNATKS